MSVILTRYFECLTIDFFPMQSLSRLIIYFIFCFTNDFQRNCVEVTILPSNGDLFEIDNGTGDSLEDEGDNADTSLVEVVDVAIHNAGAVADAIQTALGSEESNDSDSHCRTDTNTCGPGIECEYGSCCSQWGWCGWSAAHCSECCQSNCWSS